MKITDVVTEAKKDSGELDRTTARDPKTAVALRRAYSKYPTANSDIEAYIRQEIEKSGEVDQDLDRQNQTNRRQDSYLSRLQDLSRKQSVQLKSLDDENDDQEREIQDLEQQLQSLGSPKPVKQDEPKKEKPAEPRAQTGPAFEPTVGQTRREKSRAQRVATKPAATPAPAPAAKTPTPAPTKTIDLMPAVKDIGDKDTFAPTVKQLTGPSDAFSRISQELQPRQRELPLGEPVRLKRDTSQAVDAPYREITRKFAQQLATDPDFKNRVFNPAAATQSVAQQELDIAEQIQRLAGLK